MATVNPTAETPIFRAAAFPALLLRLGLGLSLLHKGLVGYIGRTAPMPPSSRFNPYQLMMGGGYGGATPSPFGDELSELMPYVQIALAVALLLGFLTRFVALAVGFLILFPAAWQSVVLIGATEGDLNGAMMNSSQLITLFGRPVDIPLLLLSAGIVWLAGLGINPFSIDLLMKSRREARANWESSGSAEFPDPVPSETPKAEVAAPFEPGMATDA